MSQLAVLGFLVIAVFCFRNNFMVSMAVFALICGDFESVVWLFWRGIECDLDLCFEALCLI